MYLKTPCMYFLDVTNGVKDTGAGSMYSETEWENLKAKRGSVALCTGMAKTVKRTV